MPRRRRCDRKLHRRYLAMGVLDLSQVSAWRRRLFDAPLLEWWPIDRRHCEGLERYAPETVRALHRYGLRYRVARVPVEGSGFEGGWEGFEIFRFEAARYPDIVLYTANNPAIV
ncbi:MAG: hypothetical protein R3B09_19960 [Nannocystaceae bacterium]